MWYGKVMGVGGQEWRVVGGLMSRCQSSGMDRIWGLEVRRF